MVFWLGTCAPAAKQKACVGVFGQGFSRRLGEDEMESFLAKNGGSSNAFTDCPVLSRLAVWKAPEVGLNRKRQVVVVVLEKLALVLGPDAP